MRDYAELEKELAKVFELDSYYVSHEDIGSNTVEFHVRTEVTLKFSDMAKIAAVLGTEHLDFRNGIHVGGYCETCRYEEAELIIKARWD